MLQAEPSGLTIKNSSQLAYLFNVFCMHFRKNSNISVYNMVFVIEMVSA